MSITHEAGDRAFYRPATDSITLPHMAQFALTAEYYSTAFHELTHSTGHSKRLNRLDKTAFFGSEAYSKEELIAEIGASALVNAAGLETAHSLRNSAAYIQNWLSKYYDALKKVSNYVRKIGGSGTVHGSIVDIDFWNHIYINPLDGTITPYYAESMMEKYVYKSFENLLSEQCPRLYENYERLRLEEKHSIGVLKRKIDVTMRYSGVLSCDALFAKSAETVRVFVVMS